MPHFRERRQSIIPPQAFLRAVRYPSLRPQSGASVELSVSKRLNARDLTFTKLWHRYHVVQEFNRGAYDYIIATDESTESLPSLVPGKFDHSSLDLNLQSDNGMRSQYNMAFIVTQHTGHVYLKISLTPLR